jgi:hypothetical protein
MLPDVFVHPRPNPHPRSGEVLTFAEIGVPLLAIEVLSETTWRQDLDERRGKPWSYAQAGVAELLLVDFNRRYMPEPVRALRLTDGRWTPWPQSNEGRWESEALGMSFAFDDPYLRVYDAAGRLKPLPHEAEAQLQNREAQLRERQGILEQLRALAATGDMAAIKALLRETDE